MLAETFGLGAGACPYIGDWAIAAGAGGLELYEHKQEQRARREHRPARRSGSPA